MIITWNSLITEAESLTQANGKAAWRTAQIVRELWKSRDFLNEACGGVLDDMASKLAKYAGRFALGVNDMIQMIEHFPEEKDWANGRLDILRDETCKALLTGRKKSDGQRHRKVISQAQYEALQRKYRELQAKAKQQEEEIERLHQLLKKQLATK